MMALTDKVNTGYVNYFESYMANQIAAERLIKSIHHDSSRNCSNIFRVAIDCTDENVKLCNDDSKGRKISTYASQDVSTIIAWGVDRYIMNMQYPSVYFSINDFRGLRRKVNNCHSINCIFIDIDGHKLSNDARDVAIEKAKRILNEAWNTGKMLRPTQVTHSGRGLGLFYVLDRSIANISLTKKLKNFFDFVYVMMIKAYTILLKETGLEVDTCVTDRTRIARMPGSYNYKAGSVCKLYEIEPVYYSLGEIFTGCSLQSYALSREEYHTQKYGFKSKLNKKTYKKEKEVVSDIVHPKKLLTYNAHQLNVTRIEFFERYIQFMENSVGLVGHREICLFLYYNALVQIIDRTEAKVRIKEVNNRLSHPIDINRLNEKVFSSVDKVKNVKGEYGYYVISNDQLIAKLGLSYAEANALHIRNVTDIRCNAKKATADSRAKIKEIVKSVVTMNEGSQRKEWLYLINDTIIKAGITRRNGRVWTISIDSMDMMIKELGINRAGTLTYAETMRVKNNLRRKKDVADKQFGMLIRQSKKSEKIVSEYCFVAETEKVTRQEDIGAGIFHIYEEVRKAYQEKVEAIPPEERNKYVVPRYNDYFDLFWAKFQAIDGPKSFTDNKDSALKYLCKYYLTHIQDPYLLCTFFYDLDTLYGAISVGKVDISIHRERVPMKVWKSDTNWEPNDVKRAIIKKEPTKNFVEMVSWNQLSSFERKCLEYEEYMCIFENWVREQGYIDVYSSINDLAEIDISIKEFLKTIIYARKDKRLNSIFKLMKDVMQTSKLTVEIFDDILQKVYKLPVSYLRFEHIKRKKNPENTTLYNNCLRVWEWINSNDHDSRYYYIKRFFKRVNSEYKNDINKVITINGIKYTAKILKTKVLFRLTIEDLKATNNTLSDNDIIAYWLNLIVIRYPQLEFS